MLTQRPFRFGVLALGASSPAECITMAQKAEALGYATFLVDDHLARPFGPMATLGAMAQATTTLRIGSCVFGNDFRHPAMLAKEAASIDVLSGGRFEFGIGTGYSREDYEQSGIPLDSPAVRVGRFAEAVQILKAASADEPVSFSGSHYTIHNLQAIPKPVQRPHPPLLIGGGSQRILSIAAREADIVGINIKTTAAGEFDWASITPQATAKKVEWVRQAAGERFQSLELNVLVPFLAATDDRYGVAAQILRQFGQAADDASVTEFLETPHALIGTIDKLLRTFRRAVSATTYHTRWCSVTASIRLRRL